MKNTFNAMLYILLVLLLLGGGLFYEIWRYKVFINATGGTMSFLTWLFFFAR